MQAAMHHRRSDWSLDIPRTTTYIQTDQLMVSRPSCVFGHLLHATIPYLVSTTESLASCKVIPLLQLLLLPPLGYCSSAKFVRVAVLQDLVILPLFLALALGLMASVALLSKGIRRRTGC